MKDTWINTFLETLNIKYPKKPELADMLTHLLSIERESVYRKLRKEVKFSAEELLKISFACDISLDDITGAHSNQYTFRTTLINYSKPSNEDYKYLKHGINILDKFEDSPDVEYIEMANKLPRSILLGFPLLAKYQLFIWMYQYSSKVEALPFSKVFLPEKLFELISEQVASIRRLENITYIFDLRIFENAIHNIRYFHSIDLISSKEKELLKEELFKLLDYLYQIACTGTWGEDYSGKVTLYIAYTNVASNYSCLYSDKYKVCRIHAFAESRIYTQNLAIIDNFRDWIQLKKKASALISQTDEKSRKEFFARQREIVQAL